jgi:8-oxo-dGTP diphosphatase
MTGPGGQPGLPRSDKCEDRRVRIIEVVGAVIEIDGRVLACRRAPGKSAAGYWEFPGGKVEHGESPNEALRRELREELSVDSIVHDLVSRATTVVGETGIDLACYRVEIVGTAPTTSTDHDELRWVRPDKLADLAWAAPDLPSVEALTAGIRQD